jgi:DNA polymerase III delta prime subunit
LKEKVALGDEESLNLFKCLISHLRERTLKNPHGFSNILNDFTSDMDDISKHLGNSNLRKVFLYFAILRPAALTYSDYVFQNYVIERLKKILERENVPEFYKAQILYIAGKLRTRILTDGEVRDIIDIGDLYSDLQKDLEKLSPELSSYMLSKIIEAIKDIYSDFVKDVHKEFLNLYDELLEKTSNWQDVFNILEKYILKFDSIAEFWLRK